MSTLPHTQPLGKQGREQVAVQFYVSDATPEKPVAISYVKCKQNSQIGRKNNKQEISSGFELFSCFNCVTNDRAD